MGADLEEAGRRIERPTQTPARSPACSQLRGAAKFDVLTPGQRARLVGHPAQLELPLVPVQPKGTQ